MSNMHQYGDCIVASHPSDLRSSQDGYVAEVIRGTEVRGPFTSIGAAITAAKEWDAAVASKLQSQPSHTAAAVVDIPTEVTARSSQPNPNSPSSEVVAI